MLTEHELEYDNLNQIATDGYGMECGKFDEQMRHWMMRSIGPYLREGKTLEFGCCEGWFTEILANRFADVTVVDAASAFLETTRKRVGDKVKFHQALFEHFETTDRFDNIFMMHVLEHLIDPIAVLRKASELLTPEGRIFAVVPNGNAISRQIAVKMGLLKEQTDFAPADHRGGHRRVYVMDTLQRDVRAAGLTIERSGGVLLKVMANFQFDALMGGPLISDSFMEALYQLGDEYPLLCASIFSVCRR